MLQNKKIQKILAIEKPDIIYSRTAYSGIKSLASYRKKNNCRLIWHVSSEVEITSPVFRLSKWVLIDIMESKIAKSGMKKVDQIICQSETQKKLAIDFLHRNTISIIRNFHPHVNSNIHKTEKIKVVWIANYKQLKRPDLFVDIADRFQKSNNIEFLMIGRLPAEIMNEYLSREIKQLKIMGEISNENVNRY